MRQYEAMIILKPDLAGEALDASFKDVVETIKKHKCDITNVSEWGRRPLAYDIAKAKEGFYYLVEFKGKPENINSLQKDFSLNENILRAMITVLGAIKWQQV